MSAPDRLSRRPWRWLPDRVNRRVRVIAWLSLAFQIVLIGTGGAVRLTASGLGCPTWPQCTADSFVNTPEMGAHGVIEFANRMLTFVLSVVVILAFLAVVRFRKARPDLFGLTLAQGLSIPLQAVLGGITVLTGLNPYVVGAHFAVSIALGVITTVLVWRVYRGHPGTADAAAAGTPVPHWFGGLAVATAVFAGITVVVGILTTGSGPHAGDNSNPDKPAPRNGLDPQLLQHVHSWPAYATLALTIALLVAVIALGARTVRPFVIGLLVIELAQVAVGITQARLGLPELLVGIHMVLAGCLVAAVTAVVLAARASATRP